MCERLDRDEECRFAEKTSFLFQNGPFQASFLYSSYYSEQTSSIKFADEWI